MRLRLYSDYALRVLIYAGQNGGRLVTVGEIAEVHGVAKDHLTKVVHHLGKAGYLKTVRGKSGGVRLMVPPDQIRLGEVIRTTEDDGAILPCLRETPPVCQLEPGCVARQAIAAGMAAFFTVLDGYTLADLLGAKASLPSTAA